MSSLGVFGNTGRGRLEFAQGLWLYVYLPFRNMFNSQLAARGGILVGAPAVLRARQQFWLLDAQALPQLLKEGETHVRQQGLAIFFVFALLQGSRAISCCHMETKGHWRAARGHAYAKIWSPFQTKVRPARKKKNKQRPCQKMGSFCSGHSKWLPGHTKQSPTWLSGLELIQVFDAFEVLHLRGQGLWTSGRRDAS